MKTSFTRFATCLIACLATLLTACLPGMTQGTRFINKSIRADAYFQGHYRLIAQAIERNDMVQLKQLALGQDLSLKGEKDMDLMWFAIMRENFDAIRTLVALGLDPDTQTDQGIGSALQYTFMQHDDTRYLKAMLDGGLDPNYQNPKGYASLLQRGVFGGLDHVKLLLQYGTDINARDNIGGTALYESITRVKPDIALHLVQQGADFNSHTVNGVSITWAVHLTINDTRPGNPVHEKFLTLRDLMIQKGAKWPPDAPVEVREQMRARGEKVVVPYGQTK